MGFSIYEVFSSMYECRYSCFNKNFNQITLYMSKCIPSFMSSSVYISIYHWMMTMNGGYIWFSIQCIFLGDIYFKSLNNSLRTLTLPILEIIHVLVSFIYGQLPCTNCPMHHPWHYICHLTTKEWIQIPNSETKR